MLNKSSIIRQLRRKWVSSDGKVHCINCGCIGHIRWHHVVPLGKGGNDMIDNIVPVCDRCHLAIHTPSKRNYSDDRVWGGRPRKIPQNWKDILHEYVTCQIGKTELMRMMGIKCKQITERSWYREYLDELGIESIRNNIDIINANGSGVCEGCVTGYIEYKNGGKVICIKTIGREDDVLFNGQQTHLLIK